MTKGQVTQFLSILKRCLSRLARHSARLFFGLLFSLRRAAGHLKLGTNDKRFITRSLSGVLPASQGNIAGDDIVPICSSLLPPGQIGLEIQVAGELQPLSDDPYAGTHPRPLREGMVTSPLEIDTTMTGYPSTTETDRLRQGFMTHLHLSLQTGESSDNNRTFLEDPLQESSSPGLSRLSDLHETSTTHSQLHGYTDDDYSINITPPPSIRHLMPGTPYLQYASASRVSVGTGHSLSRSISGSESRQAGYRVHKGPIYSRPIIVYGSIANMQHRSLSAVSLPCNLPGVPVAATDPGFDYHVHDTTPSGDLRWLAQVVIYDGPQISPMVASGIRRYERMVYRH
ncbi:hypothetical protein EDD22DRAFT_169730 [Suillus occidentalis]|nr:hypothetical protein EDD22DRAFT_169730 [Suillus occidentalis]